MQQQKQQAPPPHPPAPLIPPASHSRIGVSPMLPPTASPVGPSSLFSPPALMSRPHGVSDSSVPQPVTRAVSATSDLSSAHSHTSYSPAFSATGGFSSSHSPGASTSTLSSASSSSSSPSSSLYQYERGGLHSTYHSHSHHSSHTHLPPAVRRPASSSVLPSAASAVAFTRPAASTSAAAAAAAASQSSHANLHISGLQVLDAVVCHPRGFVIKRGLLQTYTPSPQSSDASGSPTRGGTPSSGGLAEDATSPASGPLSATSVKSPNSPALPSPPATFATPASFPSQSPHAPPSLSSSAASSSSSSASSTASATSPSAHFAVRPVLVKTFSSKNPTDEAITRLRFEYLAFQKLSVDVNRPLALVSHEEEGLCILYDDCGGATIDRLQYDSGVRAADSSVVELHQETKGVAQTVAEGESVEQPQLKSAPLISPTGSPKPTVAHSTSPAASSSSSAPSFSPSSSQPANPSTRILRPLTAILRLARALSSFLLRLHEQGVIYKAIRPSTILYNPDGDRCVLLEYHASSLLSRERAVIDDLSEHSDTSLLLYISPEQSGRMNRALDSRTDIYSLGIVMYQLLVGQPPFVSSDPMEVIHFHLAKACPDPLAVLQQRGGAIADLDSREKEALGWLSAIILKCAAKQAEDRYQSAAGLLSDVDYCYRLMLSHSQPPPILSPLSITRSLPTSPSNAKAEPPSTDDTLSISSASSTAALSSTSLNASPSASPLSSQPFSVGRMDVLSQFRISQKLYGREQQVRVLLDAFARISGDDVESVFGEWSDSHDRSDDSGASRSHTPPAERAHTAAVFNSLHTSLTPASNASTPSPRPAPRPELVLIAGYSGIGKTSVVDEVQKPMVKKRGLFVRGKFDLYKRNHSVLLQAFQQLVMQLLTQDVEVWRAKILAAVGEEGQVLVDVIPELEKLIGPQPPVAALSAGDAEKRFNRLFLAFVHVFSQRDHPLILFIDDLQWSDTLSLQLFRALFTQQSAYLLLIGAYRDNETGPSHPLIKMITELQTENEDNAAARIHSILLQPLALPHIASLVKDSLGCPTSAASELAKFLLVRTQGNPFFVCSILSSLHQDKLLTFDYGRGRWAWDMEQLRYANISSDVVDLLVGQIQRMDGRLQEVIKLAACIGNTFSLATLAIVAETTEEQATWELWQLAGSGMIIALHNQYDLFVLAEYFRLRQSDEQEHPQHTSHAPLHQSQQLHNHHTPPHFGQHDIKPPSSHTHPNIDSSSSAVDSAATDSSSAASSSSTSSLSTASSSSSLVSSLIPSFNSKTVLFRFAHDRIQQAASQLIPDDERQHVHLKIGRLLLSHCTADTLDNVVVDIVNHFNQAGTIQLLTSQREMREVIQLELRAAHKARQSNAYAPAVEYLQAALLLLNRLQPLSEDGSAVAGDGRSVWQFEYELSVAIHVQLAEALRLNVQLDEADALAVSAFAHTHTVLDQVALLEVRQDVSKLRGFNLDACDLGVQSLKLLGYELASIEEIRDLAQHSEQVFAEFDRIVNGKEMTDPHHLAIFRVLQNSTSCAVMVSSSTYYLFSSVTYGMVRFSAEHGITSLSAFALSSFSHVLWAEQQPHLCYKAGQMAMHMLDQQHAPNSVRARVHTTFYGCCVFWMEPLSVAWQGCENTAELCELLGDFEFSGFCRTYGQALMFADGQPLEKVRQKQLNMMGMFQRKKMHGASTYLLMYRYVLAKLIGEIPADADTLLYGDRLVSLETQLDELKEARLTMFQLANLSCQTMLNYYLRRFNRAVQAGDEGWQVFLHQGHSGAAALISNVRLLMYYALSMLAAAPCVDLEAIREPVGLSIPDTFDAILGFTATQLKRAEELDAAVAAQPSPRQHDRVSPISPNRSMFANAKSGVYRNLTVHTDGSNGAQSTSHILARVTAIQRYVTLWATHNPTNFLNKQLLIDAERLRVYIFSHTHVQRYGPRYDLIPHALRLYEKSIALSRESGFTQEEALANELCGRFCLAANSKREGEGFLRSAYWCWAQYGCALKQQQMKAEFPHIFHADAPAAGAGSSGATAVSSGSSTARAVSVRASDMSIDSMLQRDGMNESALSGVLSMTISPDSSSGTLSGSQSATLGASPSFSYSLPVASSLTASGSGTSPPAGLTAGATLAPSTMSTAANAAFASAQLTPSSLSAASPSSWDHVDIAAVMKACMAFSVETDLSKLTRSLLWLVIQTAGASRGTLLLKTGDQWAVELVVSVEDKEGSQSVAGAPGDMKAIGSSMPLSMFNLVQSTHTAVLLSGNELKQGAFQKDAYLSTHRPKACLAVPILQQNKLTGLLYLQNDHTADSFTRTHLQILTVLTQQAALSIENARLYARLQQRTQELTANNEQLQNEVVQRQAAQDAMRVAKEAAEKAAETKSSFLSNMSHEIRTPMNAVLGASRLLLDTDLTQEQSSYLTMITNSGKLLLTIINDVLDFSRIESNNLELEYRRFSLMECVENACHLCFDMAAKKQLDLAYTVDRHVPGYIYGDSSRLQQILLNLLSNACKFTPPGGQIVVTVACRLLDQTAPAVSTLAKAAAAQALAQGHSPASTSSSVAVSTPADSSRGSGGGISNSAVRSRIISATPQPQPSRRLATAQPSITTSSTNRSVGLTGTPRLSQSAQNSPLHTPNAPSTPHTSFTPPSRQYVELEFTVRDTGLGMSEETQSRLFKSFSQGDSSVVRRFGGTGLGLAISKRLALAMHGSMGCTSRVGEGSTFTFTIQTACASPASSRRTLISTAAAVEPSQRDPGPFMLSPLASPILPSVAFSIPVVAPAPLHKLSEYELVRLSGKRIMLVSDLRASREALVRLLTSYDMQVHALPSLQAAMDYAQSVASPQTLAAHLSGDAPAVPFMPNGVLLDFRGCSSTPQQMDIIDQLMRAFVTTAHAVARAQTSHSQQYHAANKPPLPSLYASDSPDEETGQDMPASFTFTPIEPSTASTASLSSPSNTNSPHSAHSTISTFSMTPAQRVLPVMSHPVVIMLTTRIVGDDSGGGNELVMEFVKPLSTVQNVEDDDSSKEEEDDADDTQSEEEDEKDEEATEEGRKKAADQAAERALAVHPGDPAAFTHQMVLAKLSNLEQHAKRKDERQLRHAIRKDSKIRKDSSRKRLPTASQKSKHSLSKSKVIRVSGQPLPSPTSASSDAHIYYASSPSSSASSNSLPIISATPSPDLLPSESPPHMLELQPVDRTHYSLLELTKPYHQSDLLQTLAEHLPDDSGNTGQIRSERWESRYSSANSELSHDLSPSCVDEADLNSAGSSGGDGRMRREQSDPMRSSPPPPSVSRTSFEGAPVAASTDSSSQPVPPLWRKSSGASSRAQPQQTPDTLALAAVPAAALSISPSPLPPALEGGRHSLAVPTSPSFAATDAGSSPSPVLSPQSSPHTPPTRLNTINPAASTAASARPTSPQIQASSSPTTASSSSRSVLRSTSRQSQQRQNIQSISADYPLSLLLAEDNAVNQKMMRMFLGKLGYETDVASSGEEVLDAVRSKARSGERYDVILMDVNMDGMDGVECTQRLRRGEAGDSAEQRQRMYIIAQTANANTESRQRCLDAGMSSFLPKPVILEELARQLKQAKKAVDDWDAKRGKTDK